MKPTADDYQLKVGIAEAIPKLAVPLPALVKIFVPFADSNSPPWRVAKAKPPLKIIVVDVDPNPKLTRVEAPDPR